jgi:hypothetical protein
VSRMFISPDSPCNQNEESNDASAIFALISKNPYCTCWAETTNGVEMSANPQSQLSSMPTGTNPTSCLVCIIKEPVSMAALPSWNAPGGDPKGGRGRG